MPRNDPHLFDKFASIPLFFKNQIHENSTQIVLIKGVAFFVFGVGYLKVFYELGGRFTKF